MTEGAVCPDEAESGSIGQTRMVRHPKGRLAEPKCDSCFQTGVDWAIIGAKFGSDLSYVGLRIRRSAMAMIFAYDNVVEKASMPNIKSQRPKAAQALEKKKLPKDIIDKFLDQIENSKKLKTAMVNLTMARSEALKKNTGCGRPFSCQR